MSKRKEYSRCYGCAWSRQLKGSKYLCLKDESEFAASRVDSDHCCDLWESWFDYEFEDRRTAWLAEDCIQYVKDFWSVVPEIEDNQDLRVV